MILQMQNYNMYVIYQYKSLCKVKKFKFITIKNRKHYYLYTRIMGTTILYLKISSKKFPSTNGLPLFYFIK